VERVLIVVAVLAGMILAEFANVMASRFHDHLMAIHGRHGSPASTSTPDFHKLVREIFDAGFTLFILFAANGGLALATYFAEPKRWAAHLRRVELEKASLQKSESDMRLAILQAQVEPHFLFNTLASVRSLVNTDPQRASQTIDALAEYLRATLPKLRADAGVASSTIGEQFAICASYLELMKMRLGERLRVDIRLPPELRDTPFPPLLLISLVENAIKHGVEPNTGVTQVTLTARTIETSDGRMLEVRVEDDGAGLELGMGEGTGLANVRAQLRMRFGAAASFELSDRSAGGVVARLVVPMQT
jgi:sensor histidine kinase YesM